MLLCATLAFDLTCLELLFQKKKKKKLRWLDFAVFCDFLLKQLLDPSVSICLESRIHHF